MKCNIRCPYCKEIQESLHIVNSRFISPANKLKEPIFRCHHCHRLFNKPAKVV